MKLIEIKKHLLAVTMGMYSILVIFLMFTDPRKLPVVALVAPIIWLFVCLSLSMYLVLTRFNAHKKSGNRRIIVYAISLSAMLCVVILLRSVNQLNGRDVLLIAVFLAIVSFYSGKLRLTSKVT
jgi:hypothetical protein